MLQAGGDPNLLDGEGNTPLHWASAGSGGITVNYPAARMTPGTTFRDCEECPEMVAIPTGSYQMGDVSDGVYSKELPVHEVMISRPFAVGKYEVTFAEWDACRAADGCTHQPNDMFWGRGTRPVINVSWEDAQEYVKWLSHKTGKPYRLLSEAEWEYVARAGTTTKYWWGNEIGTNNANCLDCGSQGDMEGTAPVGSFAANGFGVFDTAGNVWEWVEDCWNDNYEGAPTDGQAWMNGNCHRRVVRGGSWVNFPEYVRPADRIRLDPGLRNSSYGGFRLARTLTP
ncbi:MAG: formylglycine-generating enzyme family protein [Nitrospira sp. SB0677_bin_15]|nr:formylglycine-generating enzyme family protein [Nitrospira sp. SB0667_bin_9]MYD31251.1 formylglycine-generating enzyme family protein [Nitrospira sp. SB0661_bin_20]MYG39433.1 formylglycine-generating enzyme family protein [Nitrospira sp. SB0677_bin_15]